MKAEEEVREARSRDWSEAVTSQKALEAGRSRKDPPLEPLRERHPADILISGLQNSKNINSLL